MVAVMLLFGVWLLIVGEFLGTELLCMLGCRVARAVSWEEVERKEEEIFRRARLYLCSGLRWPITSKESYRSQRVPNMWSCLFPGAAVWLAWLEWREMVINISRILLRVLAASKHTQVYQLT